MTITLLVLLGCNKDAEDTAKATDTGQVSTDDTDTTGTDSGQQVGDSGDSAEPEPCYATYDDSDPDDGDAGWFYRQGFSVEFDLDDKAPDEATAEGASFSLWQGGALGDTGAEPVEVALGATTWDASFTEAEVALGGDLEPSTTYTLVVGVCGVDTEIAFSTDAYGAPLDDELSLVDKTWVIKLAEVDYVEPAGLGALIQAELNVIGLLGVTQHTDEALDMIVAQGTLSNDGSYVQRFNAGGYLPTYDLPGVDFTASPFFVAESDYVEFLQDGIQVPIHDFHVEGTVSPDGSSLGGGVLIGLIDTRYLASEGFNQDEDYVCKLLETFGGACDVCPDKEALCVGVRGEGIFADLQEGLVIEPTE